MDVNLLFLPAFVTVGPPPSLSTVSVQETDTVKCITQPAEMVAQNVIYRKTKPCRIPRGTSRHLQYLSLHIIHKTVMVTLYPLHSRLVSGGSGLTTLFLVVYMQCKSTVSSGEMMLYSAPSRAEV